VGVRWGRLCICPGLVLSPAHQVACPLSRPNLVSLDLGFNDLTDLQGMMASLSTLQHLRLLVLQGNPLALVPYYRGFTVDSLVGLSVLDDVTVPPSEKHQFRELSRSGGGYGRGGGPGDCPRIPTPACAHLPQTPHSTSTLVRCSVAWSGFSPELIPGAGTWRLHSSLFPRCDGGLRSPPCGPWRKVHQRFPRVSDKILIPVDMCWGGQ
jgi:hypothetical protein